MSTRSEIIRIGDELIRDKGYNAFSFYTISKTLGIKNASIHYYFPTKTDLGIAIVEEHIARLEQLMTESAEKDPVEKLKAYLSIYSEARAENRFCIIGSLTSELTTTDAAIQAQLKILADKVLVWVTEILKEGKEKSIFTFESTPRTKALMVISNMLASIQLSRLTGERDFTTIKDTIIKDLKL